MKFKDLWPGDRFIFTDGLDDDSNIVLVYMKLDDLYLKQTFSFLFSMALKDAPIDIAELEVNAVDNHGHCHLVPDMTDVRRIFTPEMMRMRGKQ